LAEGFTEEAANAFLKSTAHDQAWMSMKNIIDDPGLRSQMDIVGRNFIAFPRATREMVRRWGATLWQDPTRARRVMLSLEALKHSGVTYTDQNGELTFIYPASGVMMEAMANVTKYVPGLGGFARFPVGADLTGKVQALAPGMDNPFRFSMSPLINIPMRQVFNLMPEHQSLWTEIDTALNGNVGQGRGVLGELTPGAFQGYAKLTNDDRNSMIASAMVSAIANLTAADPDGSRGLVPKADASPAEVDRFMMRIKTQVRNQLFLRATFALFAPAPPSAPSEATDGSKEDYSYSISGIRGLAAEYKQLLNEVDGDIARANSIWVALHPDKLVYEQAKSQGTVSKANLPATATAMSWMENNLGFIDKYKSVAAYFIPDAKGDYDQTAYRAQLELGIRERKTPREFYEGARVATAEQIYYLQQDDFNAKVQAAKAAGNETLVSTYNKMWSSWKKQFLNANPLLAAKWSDFGSNRSTAEGQLADLRVMLRDHDVPSGNGYAVQVMIQQWDAYKAWVGQHDGTDNYSAAIKKSAAQSFHNKMSQIVKANPGLKDLYSGVFRSLDSNLPSLSEIGV
jgi:hypothetical protein